MPWRYSLPRAQTLINSSRFRNHLHILAQILWQLQSGLIHTILMTMGFLRVDFHSSLWLFWKQCAKPLHECSDVKYQCYSKLIFGSIFHPFLGSLSAPVCLFCYYQALRGKCDSIKFAPWRIQGVRFHGSWNSFLNFAPFEIILSHTVFPSISTMYKLHAKRLPK